MMNGQTIPLITPKTKIEWLRCGEAGFFCPTNDITALELSLIMVMIITMILPTPGPIVWDTKGYVNENGLQRHFQQSLPPVIDGMKDEKSLNN